MFALTFPLRFFKVFFSFPLSVNTHHKVYLITKIYTTVQRQMEKKNPQNKYTNVRLSQTKNKRKTKG